MDAVRNLEVTLRSGCHYMHDTGMQVVTSAATQSFRVGDDASHRTIHYSLPSLKFVGLPIPKIWVIFVYGVKRPGLVSLTFDLSTSKWGHGSPLSWASFLPIFSFISHAILDLGSGIEQTDTWADLTGGHSCSGRRGPWEAGPWRPRTSGAPVG